MIRVARWGVPVTSLWLAGSACVVEESSPHLGVWNMVASHEAADGGGRDTVPMPHIDYDGDTCSGEFVTLEFFASGDDVLTNGYVHGYGEPCAEVEPDTGRVMFTWDMRGDAIAVYDEHTSSGDTTEAGIPHRDLVVLCQVDGAALACQDPEGGPSGSDFARPACASSQACGAAELCFAEQCIPGASSAG